MNNIVVTGASGNVGREQVRLLAAAGEQVSAVSRRLPAFPSEHAVTSHAADLGRPEEWRTVLAGSDALFLLVAGDAPVELLEIARESGVGRVVLLSTQGAGTRPEFYAHARSFEDAVRASGLEWTILRSSGFAVNAMMWAESVRTERTVAAPFGDVALPVIDPADIAAAAAVVLRSTGHAGQIYDVTGPASISPRQQAEAISVAIGEALSFVELSRDQAFAGMSQMMPPAIAEGTLNILGEPLPAEQKVSDAIERLVGRPGTAFENWAERHAGAFRA